MAEAEVKSKHNLTLKALFLSAGCGCTGDGGVFFPSVNPCLSQ